MEARAAYTGGSAEQEAVDSLEVLTDWVTIWRRNVYGMDPLRWLKAVRPKGRRGGGMRRRPRWPTSSSKKKIQQVARRCSTVRPLQLYSGGFCQCCCFFVLYFVTVWTSLYIKRWRKIWRRRSVIKIGQMLKDFRDMSENIIRLVKGKITKWWWVGSKKGDKITLARSYPKMAAILPSIRSWRVTVFY